MATQESRFFSIDQLGNMAPPTWLIDGLFEANSLVMVAGPPGSYKSFLVLDWIMCMATGRKWQGRKTLPAKVLYVLGEGRSSLIKRIKVWEHYNQISEKERLALASNFLVTFDVPQLTSKASVDNLLAGLADLKYQPSVIVVDTFARSFVGMDENSSRDTGMWIDQADRLRALGYTVIFLHHTTKNTEFGVRYRGSSAIMGAMDTAMTLLKEGGPNRVKLEVTKQKDHDEGDPIYLQRLIVRAPGVDAEGSVVLVPTTALDERFSEEELKIEQFMQEMIEDQSFESDAARAREVAAKFGLNEEAARHRIKRKRQRMGDSPAKPNSQRDPDKTVEEFLEQLRREAALGLRD